MQKTVQIQVLYAKQLEKYIIDAVKKYKDYVPDWISEQEFIQIIMHMHQEKVAKKSAIVVINEPHVSDMLSKAFERMRVLDEIIYSQITPTSSIRNLRALKRMDLALNLLHNNKEVAYFYNLKRGFDKKIRLGGTSIDNPLIQSILEELDAGVPITQIKDAHLLLDANNLDKKYSARLKRIKDPKREYYLQWAERNKERLKKYRREYALINKERIKMAQKEHYLRNKEEIDKKNRQWYYDHKEEVLKRNKKRYEENIDREREKHCITYLKRGDYYRQKGREYHWENRERILERKRAYAARMRKMLKGKNS